MKTGGENQTNWGRWNNFPGSLLLRWCFVSGVHKKNTGQILFVDSWKKICKDSCKMIKISFTQSSFKTVSTWRWLITKVSFVPWLGLLLYLSKWPFYDFINGGDPKCLLSGMILQVLPVNYKLRTKNFEICRESVWEVIFLMHLFKATFYGEFHGSFYYYKPKQCTIIREIPQNHHRFILFDPPKKGSLMTPEFHGEFSSQKIPAVLQLQHPKFGDQQGHQLISILMSMMCRDHGNLGISFLDWVNLGTI